MTATEPSATRAYHHGDLRRALLEAATELASAGGVDGVVVREAARQVGVSPSAAYRHFPSRDGLLAAVGGGGPRAARSGGCSRPMPATRGLASGPPGRAYIKFALDEPGLFEVAFRPCPPELYVPEDPSPYHVLAAALDALERGWRAGRPAGGRRGAGVGRGPRCRGPARRADDPADRARAGRRGDPGHGRRRVAPARGRLTARVHSGDGPRPRGWSCRSSSACSGRRCSARSSASSARSTSTRPGCVRTCSCPSGRPASPSCRSTPFRRPAPTRRASPPRSSPASASWAPARSSRRARRSGA